MIMHKSQNKKHIFKRLQTKLDKIGCEKRYNILDICGRKSNDDKTTGTFYEQELQNTNQPDFRTEKRKRKRKR